jgi:selenocysteine lyase/cysteine desulfurase
MRTPQDKMDRAGIISFSGNFDPLNLKDKLKSLGVVVNVRGGALRVSPHFYNTEEEILRLFKSIDSALGLK